MLTNWIVAIAATSFLLGFMTPMFSPQAHALISMGTYLVMWFILTAFEKRKRPTYSNAPYVIFLDFFYSSARSRYSPPLRLTFRSPFLLLAHSYFLPRLCTFSHRPHACMLTCGLER